MLMFAADTAAVTEDGFDVGITALLREGGSASLKTMANQRIQRVEDNAFHLKDKAFHPEHVLHCTRWIGLSQDDGKWTGNVDRPSLKTRANQRI